MASLYQKSSKLSRQRHGLFLQGVHFSAAKSIVTGEGSNSVLACSIRLRLAARGHFSPPNLILIETKLKLPDLKKNKRVTCSARFAMAHDLGVEGTCLTAPGSAFSSSQKTAVTVTTLEAIISSVHCMLTALRTADFCTLQYQSGANTAFCFFQEFKDLNQHFYTLSAGSMWRYTRISNG